ncbi:Uncharacterised protein [Neisseria lactamica]|uniref:Uncharacterized protein n=1 Tax=Neisseria lactamica TaxID=486 RepID=A0A378VIJ3_NEILA|nr:Uncharacterised protein [Neisseria lactamica]
MGNFRIWPAYKIQNAALICKCGIFTIGCVPIGIDARYYQLRDSFYSKE